MRGIWLAVFFCCALRAENCPWLNAATVGGLLGVPVTVQVSQEGTCEFRSGDSTAPALRVEVHVMQQPATEFKSWLGRCEANAPHVRGIGNDAVECESKGAATILSRVRERAFLVAVTGSSPAAQEQARKAAEQVAGNLF